LLQFRWGVFAMMCGVQIMMFLLGSWLMGRTAVRVGASECRTPATVFAGIFLALQLPIAVGMGFAVGGAEGIKATREGIDPQVATSKVAKKYWWMDLAVPGVAAAIAGGIFLKGLKPVEYLPPPPDEPVGVTDHRATMREKQAENERITRDRRRPMRDDDEFERDVDHDAPPLYPRDRARVEAGLND
jgi:hypothetical protein